MTYYYHNDNSHGDVEIWINGSFHMFSRANQITAVPNIQEGDRITIIKEEKVFKRVIKEFLYFNM